MLVRPEIGQLFHDPIPPLERSIPGPAEYIALPHGIVGEAAGERRLAALNIAPAMPGDDLADEQPISDRRGVGRRAGRANFAETVNSGAAGFGQLAGSSQFAFRPGRLAAGRHFSRGLD